MVKKKKKSNKGGRRASNFVNPRRKKLNGRQLLLEAIIKRHLGATKIASFVNKHLPESSKLDRQTFTTARNKGVMPIKHVKKLSEILDVPEYALNYYGMQNFYGTEVPWDKLIKQCKFLSILEVSEILDRGP